MDNKKYVLPVQVNKGVRPCVVIVRGDWTFVRECASQEDAVKAGWFYWKTLTMKQLGNLDEFYAAILGCNDEGIADPHEVGWIITDWLVDPLDVTYYDIRSVCVEMEDPEE